MNNLEKSDHQKKKVIVIGAGIGGLYTAWKLSNVGFSVKVLEKQKTAGGFASSIHYKDCKIDIGPHYVSLKKKSEVGDDIRKLLGKEIIEMPNIHNWYKSYFNGKILDNYPTINDVVTNFGIGSFFQSFFSIMFRNSSEKSIRNTEDYLVFAYGKFLYEKWCKPYLFQNYGHVNLPLEYVQSRFKPITIQKILNKLKNKNTKITRPNIQNEKFFDCYFQYGMGSLIKILCNKITSSGGEILLGVDILSIDHGQTKTVQIEHHGNSSTLECDLIVYATPINVTTQWFENIHSKDNNKKTNSFDGIMAFLLIDIDKLFDGWMLSIFDTEIPFFRIAQQSYLSKDVAPLNKSLVSIEIRDSNGKLFNENDEQILKIIRNSLQKMRLLKNAKIDEYKIIKIKNLYPKFKISKKFESNDIIEKIHSFENEYVLGIFEMDTGRLVSGNASIEQEEIPAAGGIYMALTRSNELVNKIIKN